MQHQADSLAVQFYMPQNRTITAATIPAALNGQPFRMQRKRCNKRGTGNRGGNAINQQ